MDGNEQTISTRKIEKQAIDNILESHFKWIETGEKEGSCGDLSHIDLSNFNFEEMNLWQMNFKGSNLTETNFEGANLKGTCLKKALIKKTNFHAATLDDMDLEGAMVDNARFNIKDLKEKTQSWPLARYSKALLLKLHLDENHTAHLKNKDFSGYDLKKINFASANFSGWNLEGCDFTNADLTQTDFTDANLKGCRFIETNLTQTHFLKADLSDSHLIKLRLDATCFTEAKMHRVQITDVYSSNKLVFERTDLSQAVFKKISNTHLISFDHAILKNATFDLFSFKDLLHTDLSGINFKDANLCEVNLKGSDLTGANLINTRLFKTNLMGALFEEKEIKKASCWMFAYYNQSALNDLGLPPDNNEKIDGNDFKGRVLDNTNLSSVNFGSMNFQKASLKNSNLKNTYIDALEDANLEGADLSNAMLFKLSGANLTHALLRRVNQETKQSLHLEKANLMHADLSHANLEKANFSHANLFLADLSRSNCKGGDFEGAILHNANLRDADLSDAIGLKTEQLGGAILSNAALPDHIKNFEEIKTVDELSKNSRTAFFALLLTCLYSWLTIGTTTDVDLITNLNSSPLPVIGSTIPITWFYLIAPLILMCIYFYFHFGLQRLWESISALPAIFPDGQPLDRKSYPWILNGLIRSYFYQLKKERLPLNQSQKALSIFIAWWLTPLTILLFWLKYLIRHDWGISLFHVLLVLFSIFCAFTFESLMKHTLEGKAIKILTWKEKLKKQSFRRNSVLMILLGCALFILSDGVINGVLITSENKSRVTGLSIHEKWVPRLFSQFGYTPFVNLENQELSKKKSEKPVHLASITPANLSHRNLRGAKASYLFLARAKLKRIDLFGADLSHAIFYDADLREANLKAADLKGADFRFANLSLANLSDSDLRSSQFDTTDLTGANLTGANLQGVNLSGAIGVTREQLKSAITNHETTLPVLAGLH